MLIFGGWLGEYSDGAQLFCCFLLFISRQCCKTITWDLLAIDHSRIWDISLYMPLSLEETAYRASLSIFLCISLSSKLIFCAYHKKALLSVINHVIILLDISNPALVTFWCSIMQPTLFLWIINVYLPVQNLVKSQIVYIVHWYK